MKKIAKFEKVSYKEFKESTEKCFPNKYSEQDEKFNSYRLLSFYIEYSST